MPQEKDIFSFTEKKKRFQTDVYWVHFTGNEVEEILKYYNINLKNNILYIGTSPDYQWLFGQMIQELQLCRPRYDELISLQLRNIFVLISRAIMSAKKFSSTSEKGSSEIVRGIAARFKDLGVEISGFDMYTTSNVLGGSGISSSAAFETLIATAIDSYYNNNQIGAVEIAKIGQYAENFYFGKKSGLMDQMVCSVGGFVFLDFQNIQNPSIQKIDFDLSKTGYALIITDTKGDHSDLTDDYVAIRTEMDEVAEYFGKKVLREVDENQFWDNIPDVKKKISDRAVLRAIHFFGDNYRAKAETEALKNNRFEDFLTLVNESGDSSMNYLQNLYSCRKPTEQGIPFAIMAGKRILKGNGAVRVHGGGFAGTVQAFVPNDFVNAYRSEMDRIFGQNSCYIMTIRPFGGIEIK